MKIVRKILQILVIFFLIFMGFNLIGVIYAKLTPKIDIKSANNFYLYDDNNNLIFYGNEDQWVDIKDMGSLVVAATISVEDKLFFEHNGFNYFRILKAIEANIKEKEIVQGASTITQQYAKNLFLDFDKTWKRKWKEMWLTFELENQYTKEEILEGYLNTINYGHGNYGIENAANYYFNKSVNDLSLAEISILVGIPNSPSNYSPLSNYELSKKRQLVVLNRMVENKFITEEEKKQAYNEKLVFYGQNKIYNLTTLNYFKDATMKELFSLEELPKSYLETRGIKIYTTLNLDAQTSLENSIKDNKTDDKVQTAKVMLNSNNGEILGVIGGTNYEESTYNRATDSLRQPGSTIKPFLYYNAIEKGFTASSTFLSSYTTFNFDNNESYTPKNSENIYGNKEISMALAIAYSDNVYAVKTHLFLGKDELVKTLKKAGITTKLENVPSLPLGTYEVNIIELANAYAQLANTGYKVKPHFIKKITDINDHILYEYKNEPEKIFDSNIAFIISELLTGSYDNNLIDYGYPTCINMLGKLTNKYALKSGSTDTDSWIVGYNNGIVLASWAGYDDNAKINYNVISNNKLSWANAMEEYLKNKESKWYDIPENVSGVLVDPVSGKLATENSKNKKILYYIKGTEPNN